MFGVWLWGFGWGGGGVVWGLVGLVGGVGVWGGLWWSVVGGAVVGWSVVGWSGVVCGGLGWGGTLMTGTRGLNLEESWLRTSARSCWCFSTFLIFMILTIAACREGRGFKRG